MGKKSRIISRICIGNGGNALMYLSQLLLNINNARVRHDLGNCHNLHQRIMTAFPEVKKNQQARAAFQVLYYLDTHSRDKVPRLLVQSKSEPNWKHLPPNYVITMNQGNNSGIYTKECKYASLNFQIGQKYHFRLKANVTKKIGTSSKQERLAGKRNNGKRVPIYDEREQIQWLLRRAEQAGFLIEEVSNREEKYHPNRFSIENILPNQISSNATETNDGIDLWKFNTISAPEGTIYGSKNKKQRKLTFYSVIFDGVLEIVNPSLFIEALRNGIGPAKAYGFGLLMIS